MALLVKGCHCWGFKSPASASVLLFLVPTHPVVEPSVTSPAPVCLHATMLPIIMTVDSKQIPMECFSSQS